MMAKYLKLPSVVLGTALLACGVVSWVFSTQTDEGLTYWASVTGTAVGGMVAVLVAVYIWRAESRDAEKRSQLDSNARAVEIILNSIRGLRTAVGKGDVYEPEGWPHIRDDVAAGISDCCSELNSAVFWIQNDRARTDLIEATKNLSTNSDFLQFGPDVRYSARVHQISKWMEGLCSDLLSSAVARGAIPNQEEYAAAWSEVDAIWEEYDRWYEEELKKYPPASSK